MPSSSSARRPRNARPASGSAGLVTLADLTELPAPPPPPPYDPFKRAWEAYLEESSALMTPEERAEAERHPVPKEQLALALDTTQVLHVDDEDLHRTFMMMPDDTRARWKKNPPAGRCGICGRRSHALLEPETPEGVRIGDYIAEPTVGDAPPGSWCLYTALPHRAFFEEFSDPGAGLRFTRESAIAEAQRLEDVAGGRART